MQLAELFKEMVIAIKAAPGSTSTQPTDTATAHSEELRARASRLEYKTVREVWNPSAYRYRIVEDTVQASATNELDEYVDITCGGRSHVTLGAVYRRVQVHLHSATSTSYALCLPPYTLWSSTPRPSKYGSWGGDFTSPSTQEVV
ncbi:hypothetical protein BDY21DRAFT_146022 [Lineolata rhizophorae]|uniref:Uncharacterized protein n=1 Tax=Lineolata rhizophorae TaxID=578093 RepID=A0A6A6NMV6_9PEZI|nr:hypothetical protein BDY21DRAFT_146022 [Lineolata rhizophorae]